jgi:bifunctional DNA primase/polymerase-like protein/AAA domain-containing protein
MSVSSMTLKDVALKLAANGWYVFPLGVKSKTPDGNLAPHGFQSASNDPKQIEEWWTASPNANPGIDLGRSNLTVLDFDKGEPPVGLNLPSTLTVKTARGTHVYFTGTSKQGDMHMNGVHIGEVKSAGGYTLAPFSVHPDGPVYTLVANVGVEPLPDGLLEKLTPARESVDASLNGAMIPRGLHDKTLFRIGCKLRWLGGEEEGIYNFLVEVCEKRCENYGNDYRDMCRRKAQQACKYPVGVDGSIELNQKPDGQQLQQQTAQTAPVVDIAKWRDQFRTVGQMDNGPIDEIIKGVLQEGVCFIGANPGDGKTLVSLAFAKSICTGTPLFGLSGFSVEKPRMVIYLIPESRDRAFRRRLEAFRIPDDPTKFLCRTTSVGKTLELGDPYLMQAVRETNAVVFLDTAARFMRTNDENSAAQNQALVNDVFSLLQAGAVAVVLVHHATKASANEVMTLENMLRGTGDFAAMCDQAYGIRKDRTLYANGNGPMEIQLVSLKDREQTGELTSLLLAASRKSTHSIFPTTSIIDETGNFQVIDKALARTREIDALLTLVKEDPTITAKELAAAVGDKERAVKDKLAKVGWHCAVGGAGGRSPWHKDEGGECPFDKKDAVEVKPSKKTYDLTLNDAVLFLKKLLAGTGPDGESVYESEVYLEADKQGIPDALISKARKRLGVIVDTYEDQKVWFLPGSSTEPREVGQTVAV